MLVNRCSAKLFVDYKVEDALERQHGESAVCEDRSESNSDLVSPKSAPLTCCAVRTHIGAAQGYTGDTL